jgi:hypothetical protein
MHVSVHTVGLKKFSPTYIARKPNSEKNSFIQTNFFKIFTCSNPVLLVPGFGQVD